MTSDGLLRYFQWHCAPWIRHAPSSLARCSCMPKFPEPLTHTATRPPGKTRHGPSIVLKVSMGVHVGKEGIIINAARAISPCMSRDIYAPIPSRIIVDSKMVQAIRIFAESLRKVCGLQGDTLSVSFVSDTVPMSEERKKSCLAMIRGCVG